jgi:hypothetical protein
VKASQSWIRHLPQLQAITQASKSYLCCAKKLVMAL